MPSTMTAERASIFSRLVLAGVRREYPNKLDHVLVDESGLASPRQLHPAFYGCFDWHSAVHGHWLLARVLRAYPDLPEADSIRRVLGEHLTPDRIAVEAAYLDRPEAAFFERPYGWAWLLRLAQELEAGDTAESRACAAAIRPLADAVVRRYLSFLPKLDYPVRSGVHSNTAFALAFAHDYANAVGELQLLRLVESRARAFFLEDEAYPAHLEPSGADFLSAALMEAVLMRRILPVDDFADWFRRFLPGAAAGEPPSLFSPASVSDRADPHLVHLDGLNLSRAWCFRHLARALPEREPARAELARAAERHAAAALPHVCGGEYVGEHWLATFATLLLIEW